MRLKYTWVNAETGEATSALFTGETQDDIDFLAEIHEKQLGLDLPETRYHRESVVEESG